MYDYLQGEIVSAADGHVVLDIHGVGYDLVAPGSTLGVLPQRGSVRLFTALRVRDEVPVLYGFATPDERAVFYKLCHVSGVGPVTAIAILSGISLADIRTAVLEQNARPLERVRGVGKKTAARVVLELKDLLQGIGADGAHLAARGGLGAGKVSGDAVKGLVALGTEERDAEEDVRRAMKDLPEGASTEEIVRTALIYRSRRA